MRKFVTLVLLAALAAPGWAVPADELRNEIETDLVENILPFWTKNSADPAGGFYGIIARNGKGDAAASKAAILNARILWTFSAAYRQYGLEEHRQLADRAAAYFRQHFIDRKFGGVYYMVDAEGNPQNVTKQTYVQSFGIYGLAEHFRVTGDEESLDAAIALFKQLEAHVHDADRGGYYETMERDWKRSNAQGVDGKVGATKTMNTHIHLMEAFTTLYQVWPDPLLAQRIRELTGILADKLYNPATGHLILFCDDNWKVLDTKVSTGHDIETAWLLSEAAEALGDAALVEQAHKQSVRMADVFMAEGLRADGSLVPENGRTEWWCAAEAVTGLVNAWQITRQAKYLEAAGKVWAFIRDQFVDKEQGEWFRNIYESRGPARDEAKGSEWCCPYHNSRLGLEMVRRLQPQTVHTEVMAWSNITGVRLEGELIDFESTLRTGTPGGAMEASGRERQKGVRYSRNGLTQTTITPLHGARITQEVTDVDGHTVRLKWEAEGTDDLKEGAYFCMAFSSKYYEGARFRLSGKKITVTAPERSITLVLDRPVKTFVRDEDGAKVIYVTLLPELVKETRSQLSAVMTVDGTRHHETAAIRLNLAEPGRIFTGFGGNFRLQNVQKDPEVIDYCLRNMRVAFGRVELPWSQWDSDGKANDHIRRSAEMARRLKQEGMPVIVSCWFPPKWAGDRTTRSDGTQTAYALKASEMDRIYASLASYLLMLKTDYGVEADYFSFNESDLGIDIVHTPAEHRDWIKGFGKYLADNGLKTLMLLGDNSDATTFDFIVPTLDDASAHKYVGAISFHSWRGCDDATLKRWAEASRRLNVPLIIGEGSTDAAAHQYSSIFNESTFALYEINLYTRICAISQPWSILQWQLTSDYSILWGDGIYGSSGPLRPTQRFFNLKQLSMTPEDAFAIPVETDKDNVNVAAFCHTARGESAVHIVNNAASCDAVITGLPEASTQAVAYVTNARQHAEAVRLEVSGGRVTVRLPAESFITLIVK